jgi:hypothetical protein
MLKVGLVIGLIIAMGAMLVITSPMGQVARTSHCSASVARHGLHDSARTITSSGACSSGTSIRQGTGGIGFLDAHGRQKSSCTSASAASQGGVGFDRLDSNDAVSCSSHSP